MKKNLLKILLALVLVAFMFSLMACVNNGGGGGGGNNDDKECTEHVDEDGDGKCDVCGETMEEETSETGLVAELSKILTTLSPYIDSLKGATADSEIGIDLGIGAFYEYSGDTASEGKFNLNFAANASATNPELSLGVAVNDKDYFKLGYSAAAIYLLEGLNMINTDSTSSNKIKMDVTYLEDSIKHAVSVGMEYLEWAAGEYLGAIDLGAIGEELSDPNSTLGAILPSVESLISAESTATGATLKINEANMGQIINIVTSFINNWKEIEGTIDSALSSVVGFMEGNEAFAGIYEALNGKTFNDIITEYAPSLEIRADYDNEGAIKKLSIVIVLAALDLEFGLDINLNTLSLEDKADIDFSGYTAQDLKGKIELDLDKKGVDGALSFVINTSNAFAAEDNMIASAQLLINRDPNLTEQPIAAQAGFNGSVVFLDMTKAFERFGATTDLATKYTYSIKDEGGEVTNIKTMFKNWVDGLTYSEPQGGSESGDTTTPPAEEGAGIWGTIYNLLNGGTGGTSATTADDVIKLVDSKIGKYLKFELVDENGEALGFEEILAKITAIYATAADDLTGAVSAEGTEAGAQLFSTGEASKNLLNFVSKFIKIPAIKEKADGTGYELDFETEAEINDAATLKKYVELAFGFYPSDGQYASYINPELIRKIVGMGYTEIIDAGLYVYAGYNAGDGLDGYIGIRENKEATDSYIKLGASIGFGTAASYAEIPDDLTGYTDFTAVTDGAAETDKNYYQIFGTTWALLDAFLAYQAA